MRNKISNKYNSASKVLAVKNNWESNNKYSSDLKKSSIPEIVFISSFPPRECGIATYTQDLIDTLNRKFNQSFDIKICALESDNEKHTYEDSVSLTLNVGDSDSYIKLTNSINNNNNIKAVLIQHEFGFYQNYENEFNKLLIALNKPIIIVFHSVLMKPDLLLKDKVLQMCKNIESIIVMTNFSKRILINDYGINPEKISVIAHGTHLVTHLDRNVLKEKYHLENRMVLSTFGLLSSGKSIETTLRALPKIIENNKNVIFLIIGKTHPSIVKREGESYREMLIKLIADLKLKNYVKFINNFLPLPELLEYLQLTDVYLFTSKDPNQAVSGTFSYAISCGCPVVSTPIPHAREILQNNSGIIIDFESSSQLSESVIELLNDEQRRLHMESNGLHHMASTSWENASIQHAILFDKVMNQNTLLQYNIPVINLDHFKKMTTHFGMIQFSKLNHPDIDSGYTLDDNARALIAICQHYQLTQDKTDLKYLEIYFNFIKYCMQPEGYFLNYVNEDQMFTSQNNSSNLADSNGRAIWALGYLMYMAESLPNEFQSIASEAETLMNNALKNISKIHSTRAMAFIIKGLYYQSATNKVGANIEILRELANRLVQMYKHEAHNGWFWFESYLTYANSILPEAMLCAWFATGDAIYREIAKASFDFLLSKTFVENSIKVISNKNWMHKGENEAHLSIGGEQPIDVAYTILALEKFHKAFPSGNYLQKLYRSFNWFLGQNLLNQIVYNPCTGGCYDGLEENYVNLNQGAESTVSYLMARLTIEKISNEENAFQSITSDKRPKIKYKRESQMA